jgi:hypothetical protein
MRVRAIDENHDWTFGKGKQDYKIDDRAVAQNVNTRLMSFYGDCFFDESAGIDWWNLLGYGTKELLLISLKQLILNTEGVTALNDVTVTFENRKLTVYYDIQTKFSTSYQGNTEDLTF